MTNTVDPRAFEIAIELTNQLSIDGSFVDDCDDEMIGDYEQNDVGCASLDCEGVLEFREAIPDMPVESAVVTDTTAVAYQRGLSRSGSWWSLVERMVDVSPNDLMLLGW
ncbi:hypothetical protein PRIC1_008480 [Phytophthora ramorum]|nr:hypothetical protein KRP22_10130 [Phytophthora ramorum]